MNAERLLALYDRVAEAPDAVRRLRRFILDLAVRGKLVEQDPADEPAKKLLMRIVAEKARLVREGKFKRFKGTLDRDPASFPFSIPTNWTWCYLEDIAAIARGGSPRPITSFLTDDPAGIPWIKIGDSNRGNVYIDETRERIKPQGLAKSRLVSPGDLLLSNSMSFGFPYIANIEGCIHDGWLVIRTPEGLLDKLFLHKVLLSDHARKSFSNAASGAVVQNLNADKARQLTIPLPPLTEQHRIVAKVDELMALCEQLEEMRTRRKKTRDRLTVAGFSRMIASDNDDDEAFGSDARFTVDAFPALTARTDQVKHLRQAILDLAVRGKLVEQDPADEPAKKLLMRIVAEKARLVREGKFKRFKGTLDRDPASFPFSIPTNWTWCYLEDIAAIARGGSPRPITSFLTDDPAGIPWIKIGDSNRGNVYIDETRERIKPQGLAKSRLVSPGDLLLSNSMSFGFPYIANIEGCIHDGWLVIRTPEGLLDKLFLHKVLLSDHARKSFSNAASGAVVQNLNADKARQLTIPLPPLTEQHRIVAKVDELMALCNELEVSLGMAETGRESLLEALFRDALSA